MKKLPKSNSNRLVIGIDPSAINNGSPCGAIVAIDYESDIIYELKLKSTESEVAEFISSLSYKYSNIECVLEKVHIMPGQSASAMTKFMTGYGFLRGVLISNKIAFEDVSPATWQKPFNLPKASSKVEHKNNLKGIAQQLYPTKKIINDNQDAYLLCTYIKKFKK